MKIQQSFRYNGLRATKSDILELYNMLGGKKAITTLRAGSHTLDAIEELDDIKAQSISQLEFVAAIPSEDNTRKRFSEWQEKTHIIFMLRECLCDLTLTDSSNQTAFGLFHRANEFLQPKSTGNPTEHNSVESCISLEGPSIASMQAKANENILPTPKPIWAQIKLFFKEKFVEIALTAAISTAVTVPIAGIVGYLIGASQTHETAIQQSSQPATAPATKPTK